MASTRQSFVQMCARVFGRSKSPQGEAKSTAGQQASRKSGNFLRRIFR